MNQMIEPDFSFEQQQQNQQEQNLSISSEDFPNRIISLPESAIHSDCFPEVFDLNDDDVSNSNFENISSTTLFSSSNEKILQTTSNNNNNNNMELDSTDFQSTPYQVIETFELTEEKEKEKEIEKETKQEQKQEQTIPLIQHQQPYSIPAVYVTIPQQYYNSPPYVLILQPIQINQQTELVKPNNQNVNTSQTTTKSQTPNIPITKEIAKKNTKKTRPAKQAKQLEFEVILKAHGIKSMRKFAEIHNKQFPKEKIDPSNVRKTLINECSLSRPENPAFILAKKNLLNGLYNQEPRSGAATPQGTPDFS